ncbi:MAG: hypothetical protein ACC641_00060 [Acidiferrobacterales bacterium]
MVDKDDIKEILDNLKQQRDELRVKMHLAAADAKDEWDLLEKKWDRFEGKAKQVGDEAKEASRDIWDATKALGAEIREGYERIRKQL